MNRRKSQFGCFRLGMMSCLLWGALSAVVWADGYEEGRRAYINGDYEQAFSILSPLAETGDAEAQKILGVMYDYGQGVEKNPRQALYWYRQSAEQGQPAVQYQVGAKYFRGDGIEKNYEEAARWWEMAADGGQIDAQFNLGLMYYRGLAVEKNNIRAADLFRQAAGQGHSYAQYSLAVMYSFGQGVEKDHKTALGWFEKSAEQGVAQAQYNMGVYYENGYGIDKDLTVAKHWYERASAQGLEDASSKLDNLDPINVASARNDLSNYTIDEISPHAIRREDWVLRQNPETYTLQISSVVNEDAIVNFIKENKLESNAAYIEVEINGVKRYSAFYGAYENYELANEALQALPENLRRAKPWIRNFSVLQGMIN